MGAEFEVLREGGGEGTEMGKAFPPEAVPMAGLWGKERSARGPWIASRVWRGRRMLFCFYFRARDCHTALAGR